MRTIDEARANRLATDWDTHAIPAPWFLGRRKVAPSLRDLLPFSTWPADADPAARPLVARIIQEQLLTARGVYGFWAAQSVGDDIVVYKDDARASELVRFRTLRQQGQLSEGAPSISLADFVAPRESFAPDYIGAFALTAGIGEHELARAAGADDPRTLAMVQMATDRFTEALVEFVHRQARHDWGYEAEEQSSVADAVMGKYRGVRVSPGSSAYPDVSERAAILRLVHGLELDIAIDEEFQLSPRSSVCGLYLSHPASCSFALGELGADQVADYAERKGIGLEGARRLLG